MTESMDAFDQLIAREVVLAASPSRPVDDAAILSTIRRVASPLPRLQVVFGVTGVAVCVVVTLVVGMLAATLATRPRDASEPAAVSSAPTASARPMELPATIPDGIETGVLETALGPARWVHLSGEVETLPEWISPVPAPGGFVSLDGDRSSPVALWFTPDLIHWQRRALPFEAERAQLWMGDDTYWLTTGEGYQDSYGSFDTPSLWRSSDTIEWEAIDLSHLEPPAPQALDWSARLGTVAAFGDTTVVPLTYITPSIASVLGLPLQPDDFGGLEPVGDGIYRVLGANGDIDERADVRFEATGGGVRVIDDETGVELTAIEGVGLDFVERWAAEGGWQAPLETRLLVIRDRVVVSAEAPLWPVPRSGHALMATRSGFRAFAVPSDGRTQTWDSADGETWTAGELLGNEADEPRNYDEMVISTHGAQAWAGPGWRSTNGIDWQRVQRPSEEFNAPLGVGWASIDEEGEHLAIQSGDLTERTVVDIREFSLKPKSPWVYADGLGAVSGNTVVWSSVYEREQFQILRRDHWIITFDDLPAENDPWGRAPSDEGGTQ